MLSFPSPSTWRRGVLMLSALVLSCDHNQPVAPPGDPPSSTPGQRTTNVRFQQDRPELESRGVRTERAFDHLGILSADIDPDSAGVLGTHANVLFLEPVQKAIENVARGLGPSHLRALGAGETTPTNITQVRAPDANLVTTGDGVDVVIMDSGIEKENDDCGPNFLHEDIDNSPLRKT